MTTPANPITDWDTLATLPEGTALIDAYLTLYREFHLLLVIGRHTVQNVDEPDARAFAARIDQALPLLAEPQGDAWTDKYQRMRGALRRVEKTLKDGLEALEAQAVPEPLNAVTDWDAIRALPGGAALVDAYLNQRSALNGLLSYVQLLARGQGGMTLKCVGEEAERLIPLLDEPQGRAWTQEYWQTSRHRDRAAHALRASLNALAGELA